MAMQLRNSGGAGHYSYAVQTHASSASATYQPTKLDMNAKFFRNLRQWRFKTALVSSVDKAVADPCFREIVEMGESVVPLIISEIRSRPDMLMIALQLITGADPVQPRHRGKMAEMATDWIDWYRRKG